MKISLVIANQAVIDPLQDPAVLKTVGETWSSWHQWHQCRPENVLCHSVEQAQRLILGGLHSQCHFWVPETARRTIQVPDNVGVYYGDLVHEIQHPEEIVALHVTASQSDIVVLVGFDWSELTTVDPVMLHQRSNRDGLIRHLISNHQDVEWIIVSETHPKLFDGCENVVCEPLDNLISV